MPKPKKPSIFDGLDENIDSFFGINETWNYQGDPIDYADKASLIQLCSGFGEQNVNCRDLIDTLFAQVNSTWDSLAPNDFDGHHSPHNWRREKNRYLADHNRSDEVTLERIITRVTDYNWWNQIPVEQTLLGVRKGKVIDLVHRDGTEGKDFEIIELKTGGGYTPLSATGQVLKYGIVYAFYRSRYEKLFNERPAAELLKSSQITLVVLAPWAFYREFENCGWLSRLEVSLNNALYDFSAANADTLPMMGFKFQTFPKDFVWSAENAWDDEAKKWRIGAQKEALWAVHHREAVFGNN